MSDRLLMLGRRGSAERRVAERIAIENAHVEIALGAVQAGLESGWLSHEFSPLGPERHKDAVRRRVAEGRGGEGAIVAGRYLLTIDAVADEYFGPREGLLCRALAALSGEAPTNDNAGDA